jgi:hypothetical protein
MSHMPALADTQRLAELINQRYQLVQEIHHLTTAHPDMASIEDVSLTLGVLSRKESMLDQLRQLHTQLASFQTQDPDRRSWICPEERQRCQQMANQTDNLLREIMELDQRNISSMQQRREAIAAQLMYGQDSSSAEQAYMAASQLEQGMLDIFE